MQLKDYGRSCPDNVVKREFPKDRGVLFALRLQRDYCADAGKIGAYGTLGASQFP